MISELLQFNIGIKVISVVINRKYVLVNVMVLARTLVL